MKEMIYSADKKNEVLDSGEYKGYKYTILNRGTHPTAYVECKLDNCNMYNDERLDVISVHGGFTYYGQAYWDKADKTIYLGWDYAHGGDYNGAYMKSEHDWVKKLKRWTVSEIYGEVTRVIDLLMDLPNIEEMRNIIYENSKADTMWSEIDAMSMALYNAGYRKQSGWISVDERLPSDERNVLAYYGFGRGHGDLGQMFIGTLSYFVCDPNPHWQHESTGLSVTHWMPLPDAPEEGENNNG